MNLKYIINKFNVPKVMYGNNMNTGVIIINKGRYIHFFKKNAVLQTNNIISGPLNENDIKENLLMSDIYKQHLRTKVRKKKLNILNGM